MYNISNIRKGKSCPAPPLLLCPAQATALNSETGMTD